MIRLKSSSLCRYYRRGNYEIRALDKVDLQIEKGEFLAVVGASGSGKSTLLNLLAGLDTPTSGQIEFDGARLDGLSRRELAAYRGHKVGMIFQTFNLLPYQTALRNVELALYFNQTPARLRREKARMILEKMGLSDRLEHRPADLSGGEQQRVAIARALVKTPEVLFADEPTGNLDKDNARAVAEILSELNRGGLTIVMVTHDSDLARNLAHRIIHMHYGQIVRDNPHTPAGEGTP